MLSFELEDIRYCPLGVVPRCIHRFIEYEVPSVRQAFPTDDYLKDDPGGYLIYTDEPPTIFPLLHQYNGFLSSLNENIGVLINRLETNNVISVVGDRKTNNGEPIQDTHAYYTVTDRDSNDVFSGLWRNGKVLEGEAFRHQGRGDRTVPLISADLKMVNPSVKLETKTEGDDGSVIEHGGLPTQLQQSIVEQLTDTRPLFNAGFVDPDINLLKGAIMIGNFSPVEIQVTDPNGRRAGLDFLTGNEFTEIPGAFFSRSSIPNEPDFILIPDALDGDYLINLLGIDEGDYRVVMQSLGEQNILTLAEFSGSTSPGQEHEHSALYDSGLVPATPLSLEWLPPLENPDEPYEVAQDSILPISFTINDALGEFLDDDSVSVLIEDPSDASSAVVSFTSDVINIDNQEEKYSVDLNLFDYSFSQDSTYIVHARLFGEELGSSTFTVTSKEVGIDIWPGLEHNFIYFSRRLNRPFGVVPIVILSNNDFDAPEVVDKSSLTFGKTGDEKSAYYCLYRDRDYNRDGLEDLLCFFAVGDTGFQPGDSAGILKGKTKSGISIEGRDSVHIVTIR